MDFYIIKPAFKDSVYIKDLNLIVHWNDFDGVKIEKYKFDRSKDAKIALEKNQIYVAKIEGDFSDTPDKNTIETEEDLKNIKDVYENMLVYVKNYMNTNFPMILMYINGEWKTIGGSGITSEGYVHPLTHPATMIVEDETHRFVTDSQIDEWNNKSEFDGDYNKLTNKPTIPSKISDLELDNVYDQLQINQLLNDKSDVDHVHTISDIEDLQIATQKDVSDLIMNLCKRG